MGTILGVMQGDTMSLDDGSCENLLGASIYDLLSVPCTRSS